MKTHEVNCAKYKEAVLAQQRAEQEQTDQAQAEQAGQVMAGCDATHSGGWGRGALALISAVLLYF